MNREKVTVQIMMGGKSARMGTDKAFVELDGKTLLERAMEKWKDYGSAIQLSVGPAERAALAPEGIPAIVDTWPDVGPMSGLHAGLQACRTEYLLVVGVDMPFATHEMADTLLEVAEELGCDAAAYQPENQPQPFFALYRRKPCLLAVEDQKEYGDNSMKGVLYTVCTKRIYFPDKEFLINVNTPEELARAEKLFSSNLCKMSREN